MRDTLEMVREAWAKAGEGWIDQNLYLDFEKAFKELVSIARADEREACAKVCDVFQTRNVGMQPAECAGAIRQRGKT